MRNTEYTTDNLATMISSEASFNTLLSIMGELGLEITEVSRNA